MPAKKAASKKSAAKEPQSSNMGMGPVWAWVYAIGMVLAGLAGGLGFSNPILTYVLILAAVLVGLLYFDAEEVGQFGLRVLVLIGVQTGLGLLPSPVGPFLNGFFGGWVMFLMPVVLAMVLMFFWKKRIAPLF
jgi:hypothetical protein